MLPTFFHEAVSAMIGEQVEHYHVQTVSAVLKKENHRSLRLLERLAFSRASTELHTRSEVEPGEWLMLHETRSAATH